MSDRTMVVGYVVNRTSGLGVSGCRVEAWDAGRRFEDPILYTRSGEGGSFTMALSADARRALFGDEVPTLYFRVFDGASTSLLFDGAGRQLWRLDDRSTEVRLPVIPGRPIASLPRHATARVRGTVAGAAGPLVGATVQAYDDHIGSLTPLGTLATTDSTGAYSITYDPATLSGSKESPDLVVKVFSSPSLSEELAASGRQCRAPATAVVDLVLTGQRWRGRTAFAAAHALVTARVPSTPLADLSAEQRASLACSTGLTGADVDALSFSAQISGSFSELSQEVAFGLIRRGLPGNADGFFRHPKKAVRAELSAAIDDNLVSQALADTIDDVLDVQWAPAAASWALLPRTGEVCGLAEVLTAAGVIDTVKRRDFAQELCRHEGTSEQFWASLSSLSAASAAKVQLTLQQWSLARGHKPLLDHLAQSAEHPTLESLAALDHDGWLGLLGPSIGAPASIPGATAAERQDNYARLLAHSIASAFPMKVFRKRVSASAGDTRIKAFLDGTPAFDFTTGRLSQHESVLPAFFDPGEATAQAEIRRLRAFERLFRVVPRYEPVKALADEGFTSAHDIVQRGRESFVSRMSSSLGGTAAAAATYDKARWHADAANILFAKYGARPNSQLLQAFPDLLTEYVPAQNQPPNAIPDWKLLFGGSGACACKHCASVLSASAYLVDTLQWLDTLPAEPQGVSQSGWTALDVLIGGERNGETLPGRRPDLARLGLTCKAAHTPIPYIDLVNEILEVAVASSAGTGAVDPAAKIETTYEPDDLLAGPEIVHPSAHIGAWKAVRDPVGPGPLPVFPFQLPVDLWAEETNAYLRYLGVSRADVLGALHEGSGASPSSSEYVQYEDALAKSRLSVHAFGYDVLQGKDAQGAALPATDAWGGLTAVELTSVPVFLEQAGIRFEELEELLATRYVNGTAEPNAPEGNGAHGLPKLTLAGPDACDPAQMTLAGLAADHLALLHRFLRLRLRTGLSITELDRALAVFSPPDAIDIDPSCLRKLTRTVALAERLALPLTTVLAFYAPLDTHERYAKESPYRRAFLDRKVDSPDSAVFVKLLNGEALAPTDTAGAHAGSLQQALGISAGDFELLTSQAALSTRLRLPVTEIVAGDSAVLSLANVSNLHAVVALARALDLSIADFLVLRWLAPRALPPATPSLHDARPFSPASDAEAQARTERFCQLAEDLRRAGLSVAELQHVLLAFSPASAGLAPAPAAIDVLRSDLSKAIDLVIAETESTEDANGARTAALVSGLAQVSPGFIERLRAGTTTPPDVAAIEPFFPSNSGLSDKLSGPAPHLASPAERFSFVARWLERHVRSERLVVEKLASVHDLPAATVRHLLATVLVSPAAAGRKAIDDFLPARRGDTLGSPPNDDVATRQSSTLRLLERHARLLRGLDIAAPIPPGPDGVSGGSLGEVGWVYDLAGPPAESLASLPRDPVDPETLDEAQLGALRARFGKVLTLVRRAGLKGRLAGGPGALYRLLAASEPNLQVEAVVPLLAEETGWERNTLSDLAAHFSYSGDGLLTDSALLRIERAVALCRRLGLPSADARRLTDLDAPAPADLAGTAPPPPNARTLVLLARRAAKARAGVHGWPEVARGVRDPFREKLRDTLVAYLVPREHESRSALYAQLLIDPETSPCQLTSRVVQATHSVQVFVQRSLLHLDAEVHPPATAAKEWEYRKAYRLWEANRKVFLYPENWIEPALRDDKTPLFRDLETRLARGELTDETVERALEHYLLGLAQIARLQVMALCDERDDAGNLVATHVVARTRSQPHQWFYRKRTPMKGWLAWEPMSVDIESEGLLLTVQNRRLHLFWPVITVRPNENQSAPPADSADVASATMRMDVQIAFSTYAAGGWTARKLSSAPSLPVAPARGEASRPAKKAPSGGVLIVLAFEPGVGPEHVSLELAPGGAEIEGQIAVAVVVHRPSLAGALKPSLWPRAIAGRFVYDPAGGQWTSEIVTRNVGSGVTPTLGQRYETALPAGTSLLSTGIEKASAGGPVRVPRPDVDSQVTLPLDILADHPGRVRIVAQSSSAWPHLSFDRFVIDDERRTFFVRVERKIVTEWYEASKAVPGFHAGPYASPPGTFGISGSLWQWSRGAQMMVPHDHAEDTPFIEPFHHPFAADFARRLAARGVAGFYDWRDPVSGAVQSSASVQFLAKDIQSEYGDIPVPGEEVDFTRGGAFGTYNWELFFHVPLFIATRLSGEGRYEAAQRWMHFVFDPTGGSGDATPKRFWRFRPFYENDDLATIQEQLETLALSASTAAEVQALVAANDAAKVTVESLAQQIATLAADPFNPHAIARHRVLAYQKVVVMRYIDNLLDWGDALFRRDTLESNHEALSLYLLAADLLGPRPVTITHGAEPEGKSFQELRTTGLDAFGNAAITIEPITPADAPNGWEPRKDGPPVPDARLYFCVPTNDLLLGYWDRVADRLFKLRNCMNIDGVVRQLPLFSPPIDPALLVRAAAAGVSFDKVLDSMAAPQPLFRFLRLHAKAMELASQVSGLGQLLLSVMERRDGESLSRLRQTHERALLEAERAIRKDALRESQTTLESLRRQRAVVLRREEFYATIKHKIEQEKQAESNTRRGLALRDGASNMELYAQIAAAIPQFTTGGAGAAGSPLSGAAIGGMSVSLAMSAIARKTRDVADGLVTDAGLLATEAGYRRRSDEWRLQAQLANLEGRQLDKQIVAQEIRVAIAERELDNLDLRREQSREVEDFLRTKFTSTELYDWMVGEVSAEHYRAYQIAYDMAKKAERAYQLERGDESATFVRFGAWDSLKKGLLAGERLLADLRALDAAYLSRTDREREITKHISIAELSHAAGQTPHLVTLRDTGTVDVKIPEWLFDADYPGHYFRRLKAVSVTVATVRNATDGVQCELSLLSSKYRKSPLVSGNAYAETPPGDGRFHELTGVVEALSTSTADDDAGLFQLDLRDEKLLPYEGHGAVGEWRIEVPREQNRFPLHRISDVVLHLRYTSRDAGEALKAKALTHAKSTVSNVPVARRTRVLSARAEAPEGWARFLAGETTSPPRHKLEIPITKAGFLTFFGSPKVKITAVTVSATFSDKYVPLPPPPPPPAEEPKLTLTLTPPGASPIPGVSLLLDVGEPHHTPVLSTAVGLLDKTEAGFAPWVITIENSADVPDAIRSASGLLKPDALEDLWLTVTIPFKVTSAPSPPPRAVRWKRVAGRRTGYGALSASLVREGAS